jgi:predicted aspartyl protease
VRSIAYDAKRFDPPAPVISWRVSAPRSERFVALRALVDSGADCSLIPIEVAVALGLPQVDVANIAGIGGPAGIAPVHAVSVKIADFACLTRVIAFAEESIIGRDLLNRFVAKLHGPTLRLSFSRR